MVVFNDIIILLVVAIAISIIAHKLGFPYSIGLVLFGVILGVASTQYPSLGLFAGQTGLFSSDIFFGILLPPLIYEAALHIDYNLLKSRVWLILAFAFLGVIISTVFTGFLVGASTTIPFVFALLLGSILSPTDPIAVVDLFRRVRVPAQLSTIIESESLLNDAVGVVVFSTILQTIIQGDFAAIPTIVNFLFLVFGGLVTGLGFAALAYFLHRVLNDPNIETGLSVVMAYGSFHVAAALGFSGIISTAVTGIATGTWIVPRAMQPQVKETLFSFWSVTAYISNSIIFLSMGLIVNLLDVLLNLPLIILVFGFVTLARASFIYIHYPMSKFAPRSSLPLTWYNTLTLAGVRGAIPVVLALTLFTSTVPIPTTVRNMIISIVIGVALLSVTIQSLAAGSYVKKHFGNLSAGS